MSPLNAQVAQSVEQGTENPRVGSSILSLGTIFINNLHQFLEFRKTVLRKLAYAKTPQYYQLGLSLPLITHAICRFNKSR